MSFGSCKGYGYGYGHNLDLLIMSQYLYHYSHPRGEVGVDKIVSN